MLKRINLFPTVYEDEPCSAGDPVTLKEPQQLCFTTKPCAVRQRPYHALTMTRHEMSRMKRRVKAFSMQATHIKEIYGNFTLPKLFIDVSWYALVVGAMRWLVSCVRWSGDLPVHQTTGSCQ